MNTRPFFSKNRKRTVCVIVALILVMVAIFPCVGAVYHKPENFTRSTLPPEIWQKWDRNSEAAISHQFFVYLQNLTVWQQKLDPQILELVDPDYPYIGLRTNESLKNWMITFDKSLIPVEQASTELGISQPEGDLIWVKISVDSEASMNDLYPYMPNITSQGNEDVIAWIYVKDIEKIASLDTVKSIEMPLLPVTGSRSINISNDSMPADNNLTTISPDFPESSLSPEVPLTTQPPVAATTHASPLFTGSWAALIVVIISLLLWWR
jgi:hypothetical protein